MARRGEEDDEPPIFLPIFMYTSFGIFGVVIIFMFFKYMVGWEAIKQVLKSSLLKCTVAIFRPF